MGLKLKYIQLNMNGKYNFFYSKYLVLIQFVFYENIHLHKNPLFTYDIVIL